MGPRKEKRPDEMKGAIPERTKGGERLLSGSRKGEVTAGDCGQKGS